MITTKVIECPTCLNEFNENCPECKGCGLVTVDLTQDELNLAEPELTDPIGYAERVFNKLMF